MDIVSVLKQFRSADSGQKPESAQWYIVAASAMAAASAGPDVCKLYELAVEGLTFMEKKLVQRRLKEAILKTSCLYGVPRSLQALLPLFAMIPDDEIDHYGPRYESRDSDDAQKARQEKGMRYFDTIWGEEAAQFHRDRNFKYQPDLYLLNLEMIYQWHFSEDTILNVIETQMCNVAALICSSCPVQATWHTRGLLRHGGSAEEAKMSQNIGIAVARVYGARVDNITPVDEIDVNSKTTE